LRDAEKLICLRGIPKRFKSRKIKILHYIFLFLRVIEESTYVYPKSSDRSGRAEDESDTDTLLFPSIQTQSRLSGEDLNQSCGAQYETELLSIVPDAPSLLMEIYGIPLSLFSLISRATSLANKLESLPPISSSSPGYVKRTMWIKNLENEICAWNLADATASETSGVKPSTEGGPNNDKMVQHFAIAIHNALFLYFYRRMYNVNPWILQHYVDKVLEHLELAEKEKLGSKILNTGIIWPGFLAAVEACGENRRSIALAWLRNNGQRSGWRSFESAAGIAEELWRIREHEDPNRTWVDLLRGQGTTLVLT
jgi:arginine metabolism regulation protein II